VYILKYIEEEEYIYAKVMSSLLENSPALSKTICLEGGKKRNNGVCIGSLIMDGRKRTEELLIAMKCEGVMAGGSNEQYGVCLCNVTM
jgi:hypothetical protein